MRVCIEIKSIIILLRRVAASGHAQFRFRFAWNHRQRLALYLRQTCPNYHRFIRWVHSRPVLHNYKGHDIIFVRCFPATVTCNSYDPLWHSISFNVVWMNQRFPLRTWWGFPYVLWLLLSHTSHSLLHNAWDEGWTPSRLVACWNLMLRAWV